jgi:hypothetical protein
MLDLPLMRDVVDPRLGLRGLSPAQLGRTSTRGRSRTAWPAPSSSEMPGFSGGVASERTLAGPPSSVSKTVDLLLIVDDGGEAVEKWRNRLLPYLDEHQRLEQARRAPEPGPPWPAEDNPVLGYLIERAREVAANERERRVRVTRCAWFEGGGPTDHQLSGVRRWLVTAEPARTLTPHQEHPPRPPCGTPARKSAKR